MAGNTENGSGRRGSRWRIAVWSTAALILLLPLVAMQWTKEVNWDLTDFVVFGAMLFAACGTYKPAARMTRNKAYRTDVPTWHQAHAQHQSEPSQRADADSEVKADVGEHITLHSLRSNKGSV